MNPVVRRAVRAMPPASGRRWVRRAIAKRYLLTKYGAWRRAPLASARYLLFDKELDNFTYPIENVAELVAFVSAVTGADPSVCRAYIDELEDDEQLSREVAARLRERSDRNRTMPFGRRLGWYALVRCTRPTLVVETGVHDGLGSSAILAALARNAKEGDPGDLISFDIDPRAGWLIPEQLRSRHTIVLGNSVETLGPALAGRSVGVFVHDSDHRYDHEAAEFALVAANLGPGSVVISDNAHVTSALSDFSRSRGYPFRFWREVPARHFYPGAGIGVTTIPTASPRLTPAR